MSELAQLGAKLFHPKADFRPKILSTEKRIRGVLNGEYIFDTTSAKLVWESYFPQYWIPQEDFSPVATITADRAISGIQSSTSKLEVRGRSVPTLLVPDSFNSELAGYVKIKFEDLDAWYEEMSQIHYHPKDPFHRVDVLPTGRHIKIEINGTVLADTGSDGGVFGLWETNIPARWYLPRTSINWKYLQPSNTKTGCPYKGEASYYNAVIDGKEYKDVVWWYPSPTLESGMISGMLCFYPEKVDTIIDQKVVEKVKKPVKEEKHEHVRSCNC